MLPISLRQKRWPRIAKPMEQKSVNGSASDQIEDYCIDELMDACGDKDVVGFRKALEALVLNCFENEEPDAA